MRRGVRIGPVVQNPGQDDRFGLDRPLAEEITGDERAAVREVARWLTEARHLRSVHNDGRHAGVGPQYREGQFTGTAAGVQHGVMAAEVPDPRQVEA